MELYSTETRITCLILSFILYLIGTAGNILIIWTIARLKHLRTTQNIMVVLLAIVDLLISGYLLPFTMHVLISNRKLDHDSCKFQAVITAFLFSCSILFIMFIALSRYFNICHSQIYKKVFRFRIVVIGTLLICVVGASFSSQLWYRDDLWTFDMPIHSCIFDRYGNEAFSVVFMGLCVGVPTVVTTFCYVQIYRHVRKARTELHNHWNNGLARRKLTHEEMATKTQFAVFIAYMFMYFPFGITAVGGERANFPDAVHTVSIYICYFNSCINCILYGILNKNMRKAYYEALPCFRGKTLIRVAPLTVSGHIPFGNAARGANTVVTVI